MQIKVGPPLGKKGVMNLKLLKLSQMLEEELIHFTAIDIYLITPYKPELPELPEKEEYNSYFT